MSTVSADFCFCGALPAGRRRSKWSWLREPAASPAGAVEAVRASPGPVAPKRARNRPGIGTPVSSAPSRCPDPSVAASPVRKILAVAPDGGDLARPRERCREPRRRLWRAASPRRSGPHGVQPRGGARQVVHAEADDARDRAGRPRGPPDPKRSRTAHRRWSASGRERKAVCRARAGLGRQKFSLTPPPTFSLSGLPELPGVPVSFQL
jgi:hypothetical protein